MTKHAPDDAEAVAQLAYNIYRGMVREPPYPAPWEELSRQQQGLLEWTARYARVTYVIGEITSQKQEDQQ